MEEIDGCAIRVRKHRHVRTGVGDHIPMLLRVGLGMVPEGSAQARRRQRLLRLVLSKDRPANPKDDRVF
jgi:hypothetical protein